MNVWLSEIRQAWRASLRKPGFLLLAASVLALGLGASVAVYTLVDRVMLRPLPYPQPGRLVALGQPTDYGLAISPREYQHLDGLQGVSSMGLVEGIRAPVNVAGGGAPPQQVPSMHADRGLLPTLGVHLLLGRNFDAAEDRPHGPSAVILGHGFWQRRYAGDLAVIGRTLRIGGVPHTIIGVLPAGFDLMGGCDVLLPLALSRASAGGGPNFLAVARLRAHAHLSMVSAQVATRLHALARADGSAYRLKHHYGAGWLADSLHAEAAPTLMLFLACALFVLGVAMVNLTNLSLLRSLSRHHDVAVRRALGASRWRVVLPALSEATLVGLAGSALGWGLAYLGLAVFGHFVPADWVHGHAPQVGASAAGLALLAGVPCAWLATAFGAWRALRLEGTEALREGGRSGPGRHRGRLGRVLVMVQMALATLLLSASGLFLHAIYSAAHTPLGFSARHVLTFDMAPVKADYPDAAAVSDLSQRLLRRLEAMPGVERATVTTNLPIGRWFNFGGFQLPDGTTFSTEVRGVTPGFFATFHIAVTGGRGFHRDDRRGSEAVVVVNQAFARKYLGGHALGQVIAVPGDHGAKRPARVVGIVADTRQYSALQRMPPILYMPLAQMPDWAMRMFRSWFPLRVALRVHGNLDGFRSAIHAAMAEVAPTQPMAHLRTLEHDVRDSVSETRLTLLLVGVFALVALLLAAAGMYAVMAVSVAAREREFGVRMAMGAPPARLLGMVVAGGGMQLLVGLLVGVTILFALAPVSARLLMDLTGSTRAVDPLSLAGVVAVLSLSGLLACLLPALRAAHVQPMHALRGD